MILTRKWVAVKTSIRSRSYIRSRVPQAILTCERDPDPDRDRDLDAYERAMQLRQQKQILEQLYASKIDQDQNPIPNQPSVLGANVLKKWNMPFKLEIGLNKNDYPYVFRILPQTIQDTVAYESHVMSISTFLLHHHPMLLDRIIECIQTYEGPLPVEHGVSFYLFAEDVHQYNI